MISRLKRWLYFPVARYFRFWAGIKLRRWHPRVILVTGSSGKTTLLHLLEAQIGAKAHYSHHANSAFGISFDILGLEAPEDSIAKWLLATVMAPLAVFTPTHREKLYVVEADSDRPGEAAFIASLVRPAVVIWLSSDRSHSMNFDRSVAAGRAPNVETAIAREYGHHLEQASELVIVNGDSELITAQLGRTKAKVISISAKQVSHYSVTPAGTKFTIDGQDYKLKALLPEEAGRSVAAVVAVCDYLKLEVDPSFGNFKLPPGRSSIFPGIKQTTLVDSSYNAIPDAVRAILNLFDHLAAPTKWVVLGDMLELGRSERAEHEKLAGELAKLKLDRIILVGSRQQRYTLSALKKLDPTAKVETFDEPKAALAYLQREIKGGEAILFKGAQRLNLEGIIEHLLANPTDVALLCRRGAIWERKRHDWGL